MNLKINKIFNSKLENRSFRYKAVSIQGGYDSNSSGEIAQKFCSLQVTFTCEQEINIFVLQAKDVKLLTP